MILGDSEINNQQFNETSKETGLIAEVMTDSHVVSSELNKTSNITDAGSSSTDQMNDKAKDNMHESHDMQMISAVDMTTISVTPLNSSPYSQTAEDTIHNSSISNEESTKSTPAESNDIHQITINHQPTEATVNQLNITEIHREPKIQGKL